MQINNVSTYGIDMQINNVSPFRINIRILGINLQINNISNHSNQSTQPLPVKSFNNLVCFFTAVSERLSSDWVDRCFANRRLSPDQYEKLISHFKNHPEKAKFHALFSRYITRNRDNLALAMRAEIHALISHYITRNREQGNDRALSIENLAISEESTLEDLVKEFCALYPSGENDKFDDLALRLVAALIEANGQKIPEIFNCSAGYCLMSDPVALPTTGKFYDYPVLLQALELTQETCPFTLRPIIRPNPGLKKLIELWKAYCPRFEVECRDKKITIPCYCLEKVSLEALQAEAKKHPSSTLLAFSQLLELSALEFEDLMHLIVLTKRLKLYNYQIKYKNALMQKLQKSPELLIALWQCKDREIANALSDLCLSTFALLSGEKLIKSMRKKLIPFYEFLTTLKEEPLSQYYLAVCYLKCIGNENNQEKGIRILEKLAEDNNVYALNSLGQCYEAGLGVEKKFDSAVTYYQRASNLKYPAAQANLGWLLSRNDRPKAVQLYKLAADQDDPIGQCNLGECYLNGNGVEKNRIKAVRLFQLAADQGHPVAIINLGTCYMCGWGVEPNLQKAIEWYQRAADLGYAVGQNYLGNAYEYGYVVKKNLGEAFRLYFLAAEQGVREAQCKVGFFYLKGLGVTKDQKTAVLYFKLSAEQGYYVAQFNFGVCYYNGWGVDKDLQQAKKWMQLAAQQGDSDAKAFLASKFPNQE